jgi:hypothetical protein
LGQREPEHGRSSAGNSRRAAPLNMEAPMRQVLAFVLILGCVAGPAVASQARGAGTEKPRISACALLTPDVMAKFDTSTPEMLKYSKPQEQPVGPNGTYCDHGRIGLQINPFARPDELRKSPGKEFAPVPGLGDAAYFSGARSNIAALMVWAGSNHFTIYLGVPMGQTPESIKPRVIGLANVIIQKLR